MKQKKENVMKDKITRKEKKRRYDKKKNTKIEKERTERKNERGIKGKGQK
jgi:hypothetical protein